jgi:hypothetical protein
MSRGGEGAQLIDFTIAVKIEVFNVRWVFPVVLVVRIVGVVPFYQQACFDRIMYREDVQSKLNAGKQIRPLWDMEIEGQYYLCFGLGDDPTNSAKIDCFYCSRPDSDKVYYSENLPDWTLLN